MKKDRCDRCQSPIYWAFGDGRTVMLDARTKEKRFVAYTVGVQPVRVREQETYRRHRCEGA